MYVHLVFYPVYNVELRLITPCIGLVALTVSVCLQWCFERRKKGNRGREREWEPSLYEWSAARCETSQESTLRIGGGASTTHRLSQGRLFVHSCARLMFCTRFARVFTTAVVSVIETAEEMRPSKRLNMNRQGSRIDFFFEGFHGQEEHEPSDSFHLLLCTYTCKIV